MRQLRIGADHHRSHRHDILAIDLYDSAAEVRQHGSRADLREWRRARRPTVRQQCARPDVRDRTGRCGRVAGWTRGVTQLFTRRPSSRQLDFGRCSQHPRVDTEGANAAIQERRRQTKEFGYRVCGRWDGDLVNGVPRICVMPHGHQTSPHRDVDGVDLVETTISWPGASD